MPWKSRRKQARDRPGPAKRESNALVWLGPGFLDDGGIPHGWKSHLPGHAPEENAPCQV